MSRIPPPYRLLFGLLLFVPSLMVAEEITLVPGDAVVFFKPMEEASDYELKMSVSGSWADIDMSSSMEWTGSLAQYPAHISDCPDDSAPNYELYSFSGTTNPYNSSLMYGDGWFGKVYECGEGSGGSGTLPNNFTVKVGDSMDFGIRVAKASSDTEEDDSESEEDSEGGNVAALVGERIHLEGYSVYIKGEADEEVVEIPEAGDWGNLLPNAELFDAASDGDQLTSEEQRKNHINVYATASKPGEYKFDAVPHAEPDSGKSGEETLTFHALDLDIDGVEDEYEEDPGGYLAVGTNNLQKITHELLPSHLKGRDITLKVEEGVGVVVLWEDEARTVSVLDETLSEKIWTDTDTIPDPMYVELLSTTSVRL